MFLFYQTYNPIILTSPYYVNIRLESLPSYYSSYKEFGFSLQIYTYQEQLIFSSLQLIDHQCYLLFHLSRQYLYNKLYSVLAFPESHIKNPVMLLTWGSYTIRYLLILSSFPNPIRLLHTFQHIQNLDLSSLYRYSQQGAGNYPYRIAVIL